MKMVEWFNPNFTFEEALMLLSLLYCPIKKELWKLKILDQLVYWEVYKIISKHFDGEAEEGIAKPISSYQNTFVKGSQNH